MLRGKIHDIGAVMLTGKEYTRLMQAQKAYEETVVLYNKVASEYRDVVDKGNEIVNKYNALVDQYITLKDGAQNFRDESQAILEQLDAENSKLKEDKKALEARVSNFIEQRESFFLTFDDSVKVFTETVTLKLTEFEYEQALSSNKEFKGIVRDPFTKDSIQTHVETYLKKYESTDIDEVIYDLYQSIGHFKRDIQADYLNDNDNERQGLEP
jgi:predicted nuclease with TOPRIM domain